MLDTVFERWSLNVVAFGEVCPVSGIHYPVFGALTDMRLNAGGPIK